MITITITADLTQSTDSMTAMKLDAEGKAVELSIPEIDALKVQLGWLLSAKVEERALKGIEPGKLYYHTQNRRYYWARLDNGRLVFDQSDKAGTTRGLTLTCMYVHYLRLVAQQPKAKEES